MTVTNSQVAIGLGQDVTCTINNDDVAPSLTLKKIVVNDNGGSALASAWTLTATGSGGFSGVGTQNADVTKNDASKTANVKSNVQYTLSESGAPTGYSAGTIWSCSGGTFVSPDKITLDEGGSATCSITNDDTKASPAGSTVQTWVIKDSIAITGIRAGASDASSANVVFRVYSNSSCTPASLVGSETDSSIVGGAANTTTGVTVTASGFYYWTATYSGDQFNNTFTTACGDEITQILAKDAFGGDERLRPRPTPARKRAGPDGPALFFVLRQGLTAKVDVAMTVYLLKSLEYFTRRRTQSAPPPVQLPPIGSVSSNAWASGHRRTG